MDVFHAHHASRHSSWSPDSGKVLLITSLETCVQLLHVDGGFTRAEAACLSLSSEEALDIASRIRRVLAGEKGVNPEPVSDQPRLIVHYTNAGDPFREGVELDLESGEYMRDFSFPMDESTAGCVASSLEKAAAAIGSAISDES